MNKVLVSFLFIVCLSLKMLAQDTIITMDGSKIPVLKFQLNNELEELEYLNQDSSNKTIDLEDVFSIKGKSSEQVLYKLDSAKGLYLCVDDMKCYLRGVQEAKEGYGALFASLTGLAAGVGSVIYATSTPNPKVNLFWAPVIPLTFCIGVSFTKPSFNRIKSSYPEWSNNDRFMAGYYYESRRKRVRNAILSSITGFVVSSAAFLIIDSGQQ